MSTYPARVALSRKSCDSRRKDFRLNARLARARRNIPPRYRGGKLKAGATAMAACLRPALCRLSARQLRELRRPQLASGLSVLILNPDVTRLGADAGALSAPRGRPPSSPLWSPSMLARSRSRPDPGGLKSASEADLPPCAAALMPPRSITSSGVRPISASFIHVVAVRAASPTRASQELHSPCWRRALACIRSAPASSAAVVASRWPTRKRETASIVSS